MFRILLGILLAATPLAAQVRVGAAISLRDALTEIGKAYEADTGQKVAFTFGSSGQVAAQITSGAEIDLFISAADKQVKDLIQQGLALEQTRRVVAGNTLVLVAPSDSRDAPAGFESLASESVKRVAIGEPRSVPAGEYAMQVLKKLALDQKLTDRLVYGTNVRQVLSYVERGEVSAGIVYSTDAKESGDKVKVIATAPAGSHEPIIYPAVIVKAARQPDAARKFLDYLASEKPRAILDARGFSRGE